jgi:hypothetical protein
MEPYDSKQEQEPLSSTTLSLSVWFLSTETILFHQALADLLEIHITMAEIQRIEKKRFMSDFRQSG